jgi:hypothetical protein
MNRGIVKDKGAPPVTVSARIVENDGGQVDFIVSQDRINPVR